MPTLRPTTFDGETTRPLNDAEYAQWQLDATEAQAQADAQTAKQIARQALLTRLGITSDEAKLLLG